MAISFKFGYKLSTDQLNPFAILRHLEWFFEKMSENRSPFGGYSLHFFPKTPLSASKWQFHKNFRLQKMACNSETKGKNFFFRREIFFLFFLHWPTVILACSGALQPYWKYLRIASENGQKSRIYYVKGAKTSPSLTVLIQVSNWAEIWYIASIYIHV